MTSADISSSETSGKRAHSHHVYVITASDDGVKIGLAKDPEDRLKGLQTGHYEQLSLTHRVACTEQEAFVIERLAHSMLIEDHRRGEWFRVLPERAKAVVDEAFMMVRSGKVVKPAVTPKKHQASETRPKRLIVNHILRSKLYGLIKESDFPILVAMYETAERSGRTRDKDAEWTIKLSVLRKLLPEKDKSISLGDRIHRIASARTKRGRFAEPKYIWRNWPPIDDFAIFRFTSTICDENIPEATVRFGLDNDMQMILADHSMRSVLDWVISEAIAERAELTRKYIEGFPPEKQKKMLEAVA